MDLCGGYLEKSLSKDSKITVILMVALATIGAELFMYLYKGAILSSNIEMNLFIKKLIIEVVYNALLTIILYPLMQKLGYKIEEIYRNPQIMTRYF